MDRKTCRSSPLLIAQISDIHIGYVPADNSAELNLSRFTNVLERLFDGPNQPDLLILTGDITDRGDEESFAETAKLLHHCPCPIWPLVGNHDSRGGMLSVFPQVHPADGGFLHYVLEPRLDLRIICLDTLEEDRHGGAFCEARARWLSERLNEAPNTPTVIFMHHPPIISGVDWMDPAPNEAWINRLRKVLTGQQQIQAIHCGHLHRQISTSFAGIPLGVTPSIAPLVAIDLKPIDPLSPDDRDLIIAGPPAYALHIWNGESLVSHYEQVGDWPVLAKFHAGLQPMLKEMLAERC